MPWPRKANTDTRMLPCALNPEELLAFGDEMAKLHKQLAEIEEEKKAAMKAIKERQDAMEARLGYVCTVYLNKEETRPVVCDIQRDFHHGFVHVRRRDTGVVVEEGILSAEERQQDLPVEPYGLLDAPPSGTDDK